MVNTGNKSSIRVAVAALVLGAATLVGIATREGYSDEVIIPIKGDVPTIGFGETVGVKPGDRTTPTRALVKLLSSAESYAQGVRNCIKVPLYQHEFDAYVSLAYNIGVRGFCGSTLVRTLNRGDYVGACREILRWDRASGRVVRGLTIRRQAEYKQCMGAP